MLSVTDYKCEEQGSRIQKLGPTSQGTGARSQESEARAQEPGAKSQEPGARSQDLGAGSQGSGHRGQRPGVRGQNPGGRDQEAGALGHKAPLMVACGDTLMEAGLFGTFHLHSECSQGLIGLAFPQAVPCLWWVRISEPQVSEEQDFSQDKSSLTALTEFHRESAYARAPPFVYSWLFSSFG